PPSPPLSSERRPEAVPPPRKPRGATGSAGRRDALGRPGRGMAGAVMGLALGAASFLHANPTPPLAAPASAHDDWPAYLGGKGRSLYSPLAQINRGNVSRLEVAWTYDTGEKGEYQSNNLIIGGVLYTVTTSRRVVALEAATGRELWTWDPAAEHGGGARRQRGLVYWQDNQGGGQRLFTGAGNHLYALDPKTGQVIR